MVMISLPQISGPDSQSPPTSPTTYRRAADVPMVMKDSHGRVIRDVRLSVTDRCNFRCVYCMDPDFRYMPKTELLTLEEYVCVAQTCHDLGVTKLRITGGEPTLYRELDALIEAVGKIGFDDLSMTTNSSTLTPKKALQWKAAGLDRLTFSLDSLRDKRVKAITRTNSSPMDVVNAIRVAREAGLEPIKVNAVVMAGVNDDELADFADFAREHAVDMRLIEFMPLDSEHKWSRARVVSAATMLQTIEARHALQRIGNEMPSSTSMNYVFTDGAPGRIGLIAPVTQPFCGSCSRLRITADGKVRPCLFSHDEWDLRAILRDETTNREHDVHQFLIDSTWTKKFGHGINEDDFIQPQRTMSSIGG